ncbi:DUF6163 family protein [Mesorhizobium qingshengii]|uniref:Permeases of the major facilitator superfamily n=1 Tax=Mesorhizobium qingshengii TaxID=1165689 RepID=A0A1G5XV97_9HYPH|nr:DUF6163 family protein [Mesorhizobium qingshengii]SDA73804.1 hypothetical protein SAMN02927914_02545 [Mesorhizobium qingshengii]
MSEVTSRRVVLQPSTVEVIFAWFQRVISGYCLLFGILYWIKLIGFYPGSLWRFDLMPVHWQVAAVVLAVFFPFAAAGLWMLASWGPVIWFICAVTEIVMYVGFPELFGSRPLIVVSHTAVAVLYIVFRVVIHMQKRPVRG